MERNSQHRNRYATPAQSQRGRDFSVPNRPATVPAAPPVSLPVSAPGQATEPMQHFAVPLPSDHANLPIQYPSQAHQHAPAAQQPAFQPQVQAPTAPPVQQQLRQPAYQPQPQHIVAAQLHPQQQPHHQQNPRHQQPQHIVAAPAPPPAPSPQMPSPAPQPPQYAPYPQNRAAFQPRPVQTSQYYPTPAPAAPRHDPYLPAEPQPDDWMPMQFNPPAPKPREASGLRGKFERTVAGLMSYYSASPKRAAFVAGSSLLVISAIGWTLAMQSSSANDLLAKTPFGFLLIKQGNTKGEQVIIDEEKPTPEEVAAHQTKPHEPRYLHIPKFGLQSRVLALGSKGEGIELPENIYDIGWSTQSNPPTDPVGTQLYIGHAKGITKTDAAFSRLTELKESDEITVETGDGKKYVYVVMHTEKANVSSPNISRYYNSWVIGKPGLNMLTTSGVDPTKENPSENRYATFAVFTILKQ